MELSVADVSPDYTKIAKIKRRNYVRRPGRLRCRVKRVETLMQIS